MINTLFQDQHFTVWQRILSVCDLTDFPGCWTLVHLFWRRSQNKQRTKRQTWSVCPQLHWRSQQTPPETCSCSNVSFKETESFWFPKTVSHKDFKYKRHIKVKEINETNQRAEDSHDLPLASNNDWWEIVVRSLTVRPGFGLIHLHVHCILKQRRLLFFF